MELDDEARLESFLKWAAKLGITDSAQTQNPNDSLSCLGQSVCVAYFPDAGGRGLAAARDIRKGEPILRVPKSALMTSESLLKDPNFSVAVSRHSSLSCTQILTVGLLYEMSKGKSSQWQPYLIQLPRSYDTLATFGTFEIQALQVDDAIWAAEKTKLKAESEWNEAMALMKELNVKPKLLSIRAWIWASATVSSRTLHVPWDNAGCLCPVGDFFNYAAPGEELLEFDDLMSSKHTTTLQNCSLHNGDVSEELNSEQLDTQFQRLTDGGYEKDVGAYCFYAKKNYKEGEQVLLSYGTYTNLELLEHYGFLLNKNPNDKVFIPLESDMYSSSSWPKDSLYINHNGKPSFALMSALRIWATPQNQRRSVGHLAYSGSQISAENEVLAMDWIVKKCNCILDSLPTSIEDDNLLLVAIDKMGDDLHTFQKLKNVISTSCPEVCIFLESNGVLDGECGAESFEKIRRSMNKWNLIVQWRLRFKRTLLDCISYCTDIINSFPCLNFLIPRSNQGEI